MRIIIICNRLFQPALRMPLALSSLAFAASLLAILGRPARAGRRRRIQARDPGPQVRAGRDRHSGRQEGQARHREPRRDPGGIREPVAQAREGHRRQVDGDVFIGPLKPGSYPFVGEYNEKTAKGIDRRQVTTAIRHVRDRRPRLPRSPRGRADRRHRRRGHALRSGPHRWLVAGIVAGLAGAGARRARHRAHRGDWRAAWARSSSTRRCSASRCVMLAWHNLWMSLARRGARQGRAQRRPATSATVGASARCC